MMHTETGLKVLVIVSLLAALAACGARMTAEERMEAARGELAAGDAPTAIIHLRNVLQQDPSNVDARVLLAEATFRAGDYESAAKEYLRAVDLGASMDEFRLPLIEALVRAGGIQEALRFSEPEEAGDSPEMTFWRANALARAGLADEARALFESLSAPAELHDRAQVGIARLELASQRPDEALAILEPLAGSLAGDADYWDVRGFAALRAGRADDAVDAFRKAVDVLVDPVGTRRFMLRAGEAEALLASGRLEEARGVAAALQSGNDRNPVANYLMARVELQSGNATQALNYAQAVLAAQPDSSVGHMMAGAASLTLGQTGQAERHLERAIASDPGNLPARKLLAQTRLGMQSPERALEVLGPALNSAGGGAGDPSVAALAGLASVRAGDPEAAVEILRSQLERAPDNDEIRSMLAVTLMSAGRTDEALAELARIETAEGVLRQRADLIGIAAHLQGGDLLAARSTAARVAEAQPGDAAVRNALGALFQGAGLVDEAEAWFEDSLRLEPANAAAAYNLGRIAAGRGQLDRAAELFNSILAGEPDNPAVLTALAQLDWARDDREAAIARLQQARRANPADAGSRFVLTQFLVAEGRVEEAVAVGREGVAAAPNSAPSINALGVTLLGAGQPGEARPLFQRAHDINPLETSYLLNMARASLALGEPAAARESVVNGLALQPDNVALLGLLVDLERRTGRLDEAAAALARLEEAAQADDPRVAVQRGEVLLARQQYAAAERAFAEAGRLGMGSRAAIGVFEARRRGGLPNAAEPLLGWLAEHPDDLAVRGLLADHYLAADDRAAATREYERLVTVAPDNPVILNNLAWLYGEAGDERAVALARRAHQLAPGNASIADTYGWILHRNGDNAGALELLAKAVAAAPQAGDMRYRYAVVLAETGDTAGAIREAQAVLADTGAANYHEPAQKLLNRLERGGE